MRRIHALSAALLLLLAACGGAENEPDTAATAATAKAEPPKIAAKPAPAPKPTPRADSSLIPRDILFGNPEKAAVRVSPDGKRISFLAPVDGVLNVWVGPAEDPSAAKPVTQEKTRNLRFYAWAFTNDHILYTQDKGGDENWHVYSVDLKAGQTKDLTPLEGGAARVESLSFKHPDEALIGINDRDKKAHDVHRVNIKTGERKLLQKNEEGFVGFESDADFKVRFATKTLADGGSEIFEADGKSGWKSFAKIGQEDSLTTDLLSLTAAGDLLYLFDSRDRDTSALVAMDMKTRKVVFTSPASKADVNGMLMNPKTLRVEAYSWVYERKEWSVIDKKIDEDLKFLRALDKGDVEVFSRSLDGRRWIAAFVRDNGPVKYYLYETDGKKRQGTFLFTNQKALADLPLTEMHPRVIKSRDGMDLVSYLSLPKASDPDGDGKPSARLPMVLLVHGGPWGRDQWGYNATHQWLANRGYAVLSVNFRSSTGFGKKFINAGNREWAGKMHEDLLDAMSWAVKEGIADEKRVAIMGGSYGGYATLVGLTFTPETFACGVDIVGPSNLITLLSTIPPYWTPILNMFTTRIADHRTEEGRAFLTSRSPLSFVDRIKRPLLIGQGKNDPRVKQAESDQIVKAMQDKSIPVTYVLYPDEGHGFARPENRMSFNAVAETFLAQCLGGPYEPVGDDFKGSSISVPAGAGEIYGLPEALPAPAK